MVVAELFHGEAVPAVGRWGSGRETGLRGLTRDGLMPVYHNFYRQRSTSLSMVGSIDLDGAQREVERQYGPLADVPVTPNPGPSEPAHSEFRYRELEGAITQPQLTFSWRPPGSPPHAARG